MSAKIHGTSDTAHFDAPLTKLCPVCGVAIMPELLFSTVIKTQVPFGHTYRTTLLYLCPSCRESFICKFSLVNGTVTSYGTTKFKTNSPIYAPLKISEAVFSDNIKTISPKFIDIYNQAYAAEQQGLLDICGMGYRKALEFLIKDFLISKEPENSESFAKKPLSQCIADLSKDYPMLSTVAERATWLGNDETHYQRKHEYDLDTLKSLINATSVYINLEAITDAALAIERK